MAYRFSSEEQAKEFLIEHLRAHFTIFEDVGVRSPSFSERVLQPDLIVAPIDEKHSDFLIAIEVKIGNPRSTGEYARHLKQAADYVLGQISNANSPNKFLEPFLGRLVQATFLFPSYDDSYFEGNPQKLLRAYGMHQLAARFKVGRVVASECGISLVMGAGANEVWIEGRGWTPKARSLVKGKRQIGSQRFKIET